jgi:hypothetical protein
MANEEEEKASRGFKVQDRRRFVDDAAPDTAASEAPRPPEPQPAEPPHADADHHHHAHADAGEPHAEINFTTFVMGLTTQALMHLGEIADPEHPQSPDLGAAKQMIDLLGVLRDKTKGNLDSAEEQLLATMLYDLRMRYVEVSRQR